MNIAQSNGHDARLFQSDNSLSKFTVVLASLNILITFCAYDSITFFFLSDHQTTYPEIRSKSFMINENKDKFLKIFCSSLLVVSQQM